MAIYRNISTSFWSDRKVKDEFDSADKYLYLYLLTSPDTKLCGVMEISKVQSEIDTKLTWDLIEKHLERLEQHGVIRWSPETYEVLIVKWGDYNWSASPTVKASIIASLSSVKNGDFRQFVTEAVSGKYEGVKLQNKATVKPQKATAGKKSIPRRRTELNESERQSVIDRGYPEELEKTVCKWIKYKLERGESYKETGLNSMLTQIWNNFMKHGETAVNDLIEKCMASNWKGIQWDMLKETQVGKNTRLGALETW